MVCRLRQPLFDVMMPGSFSLPRASGAAMRGAMRGGLPSGLDYYEAAMMRAAFPSELRPELGLPRRQREFLASLCADRPTLRLARAEATSSPPPARKRKKRPPLPSSSASPPPPPPPGVVVVDSEGRKLDSL